MADTGEMEPIAFVTRGLGKTFRPLRPPRLPIQMIYFALAATFMICFAPPAFEGRRSRLALALKPKPKARLWHYEVSWLRGGASEAEVAATEKFITSTEQLVNGGAGNATGAAATKRQATTDLEDPSKKPKFGGIFGSPKFALGGATNVSWLTAKGNASSIFGSVAAPKKNTSKPEDDWEADPFAHEEEEAKTRVTNMTSGEGNETPVFEDLAILFLFKDTWRVRGRGKLRVNLANDKKMARVVMRTDQTNKLILNAPIKSSMIFTKHGDTGVMFRTVNFVQDADADLNVKAEDLEDTKNETKTPNFELSTVAVRFADKDRADMFIAKANQARCAVLEALGGDSEERWEDSDAEKRILEKKEDAKAEITTEKEESKQQKEDDQKEDDNDDDDAANDEKKEEDDQPKEGEANEGEEAAAKEEEPEAGPERVS